MEDWITYPTITILQFNVKDNLALQIVQRTHEALQSHVWYIMETKRKDPTRVMMMTGHDQIRAGLFKTHWANFLNLYQHFEVGPWSICEFLKAKFQAIFLDRRRKKWNFYFNVYIKISRNLGKQLFGLLVQFLETFRHSMQWNTFSSVFRTYSGQAYFGPTIRLSNIFCLCHLAEQ